MTETVPGPTGLPIIGNLFDVHSKEGFVTAMERLVDVYGPVYQLTLNGERHIILSSAKYLLEMLDDKKWATIPLEELSRDEEAKGMFNARIDHPDWGQARRILQPSFGPLAIESMFEGMRDIANQMIVKWARMGKGHRVLLTDDFTRFTLDTIALCTMGLRFNSFYRDDLHPFIGAMLTWLSHSSELATRPWIVKMLLPKMGMEKKQAKKILDDVAQGIIDERRQNPKPGDDLVNLMMSKKDPKTGNVMRDSLIRENMIALLVAGHETTSSMLSFAFSYMISNPQVYLKAQKEVDEVVGNGRVETTHLKKLKYLSAVLRETLRLTPTVPALSRKIHPAFDGQGTTIGGGKYYVGRDDSVYIILTKAQRDPSYFGPDANEFKPERMMDESSDFAEFMKAWKPFGYGSRACIGQSFAWQEAVSGLAMILQNFDMKFSDPCYQMKIQEILTIKPDNLWVDIQLRDGLTVEMVESRLSNGAAVDIKKDANPPQIEEPTSNAEPDLAILFGSNTGTCHSLAQKLSSRLSAAYKIHVDTRNLDSAATNLPTCPIIVITATYEGEAPDNAANFVIWLKSQKGNSLSSVRYAVFGVGNRNWQATYHRIPKLIDSLLEEHGAERLVSFKGVDVTDSDIMDELESWDVDHLRKPLMQTLSLKESDSTSSGQEPVAEISTDQRATAISNGMVLSKVVQNEVLTAPGHPEKRHMEIKLPTGTTYECGDYLAVLPLNGQDLVRRVMAHWELSLDATIVLKSESFAPLLLNTPLSIFDILTGYFELSQRPSKKTLQNCVDYAAEQGTKDQLKSWLSDHKAFDAALQNSRGSFFDMLTQYPDIKMPFPTFLSSLIPLRPRQYSISSSPLAHPDSCTLTYGVLRSKSEVGQAPFEGVASNYLASLRPNDTLQISIRRTATANKPCPFRLPPDQKTTPLLMIGAGTGIAPFRGFIQERASMIELNPELKHQLAPAVLFIGCRSQTADRLHGEEMDHRVHTGAVDIHYAFSQEPEASEGCKYVGDRIWRDRTLVAEMWERGARLYICGSRGLLEGIETAFMNIIEESVGKDNKDEFEKEKKDFLDECNQRAVSDIFD